MKARVAASVILALAITVGTAGCNLLSPVATMEHYDASDGVSGSVGSVDVRNAIIVTDGVGGKAGNLVVTLVNNDSQSHTVLITAGAKSGTPVEVTIEPGVTQLGNEPDSASSHNVFLTPFDSLPGSLYPVYFQYGDKTGVQLQVPVLDGGLPEYEDLVPPTVLAPQD